MHQKRLIARLVLIAALLAAAWAVKRWQNSRAEHHATPPPKETAAQRPGKGQVPEHALQTLRYIREHGEAPPGHVGGREFQNRERRLPATDSTGKRLRYSEWDVHPQKRGQSRGPERLVTGSDHSAYYTRDHYKTFQKIE